MDTCRENTGYATLSIVICAMNIQNRLTERKDADMKRSSLRIIEDGIDAVDFVLNYGRGMKSRVLRLWLNRAKKFLASEKT